MDARSKLGSDYALAEGAPAFVADVLVIRWVSGRPTGNRDVVSVYARPAWLATLLVVVRAALASADGTVSGGLLAATVLWRPLVGRRNPASRASRPDDPTAARRR
jgi:hypothetical protein